MVEMDKSKDKSKKIRVCGIEPESIVDGPGFRYVLFVQGCPHHCHGCHNPESWAFDAGYDMTVNEVFEDICGRPWLRGVTFSGGEPFEQVPALLDLAKNIKGAGLTRNLTLVYCGSENQRVIDMKKTRRARREGDTGMVIPYKSGFDFEIKI